MKELRGGGGGGIRASELPIQAQYEEMRIAGEPESPTHMNADLHYLHRSLRKVGWVELVAVK